jgi:hypothetical protein
MFGHPAAGYATATWQGPILTESDRTKNPAQNFIAQGSRGALVRHQLHRAPSCIPVTLTAKKSKFSCDPKNKSFLRS